MRGGGSLVWWVWWVVRGGFRLLGSFYMAVSCARGALPPLGEGAFSLCFQFILALAELAFCLKKSKKKKEKKHPHYSASMGDAHYFVSKSALLTPPTMKDGHMALHLLHANINLA